MVVCTTAEEWGGFSLGQMITFPSFQLAKPASYLECFSFNYVDIRAGG